MEKLQKYRGRFYLICCVALHNITFHFLAIDNFGHEAQTATSHPQLACCIRWFKHRALEIKMNPIWFRCHSLFMSVMNQGLQSPELLSQFSCAVQILHFILSGCVFGVWLWGLGWDNVRKSLNKWKGWESGTVGTGGGISSWCHCCLTAQLFDGEQINKCWSLLILYHCLVEVCALQVHF